MVAVSVNPILNSIMSVQEAGELWGLSEAQVKQHCKSGNVQAKKIGNAWAIVKDQPNPKQRHRNS